MTSKECAKCGACATVCPVYKITGRESNTARGIIHLLNHLKVTSASPAYEEILSDCLLCGACYDVCPRGVDTPGLIIKARQCLPARVSPIKILHTITNKVLSSASLSDKAGKASGMINQLLLQKLPLESGLRYKFAFMEFFSGTKPLEDNISVFADSVAISGSKVSYFTGCFARYLAPDIAYATIDLMHRSDKTQPYTPENQTCCGLAALSAGDAETAKTLAKKNIRAFSDNKNAILTSCASCYTHMQSYPDLFPENDPWHDKAVDFAGRVQEFSSYFMQLIPAKISDQNVSMDKPVRVLYHDPCHLRFKIKITEPPRDLLRKLPNIELSELQHGSQCCGHGGFFHIQHEKLSTAIMNTLLMDFKSLAVDTVVTTCTGCLMQWKRHLARTGVKTEVQHLAQLINKLLNT